MAFYETLTRRLAQRGWLEWHTMEFDMEPVACHLAVRLGDAVTLPKIGYDETHARYAASSGCANSVCRSAGPRSRSRTQPRARMSGSTPTRSAPW